MVRFLAVLATALVVPLAAGNAFGQAAYVHQMSGSVTGTLNSATQALKTGDLISAGTVVTTGDRSSAVIKFEDGQVMALTERSSFRIVEYRYVKERVRDSNAVFALLQGGLRFISGVIGSTNRSAFRLTAGTATIGIRGTDVSLIYLPTPPPPRLVASVTAGEIELRRGETTDNLRSGQTFGDIELIDQQALDRLAQESLPVSLPVDLTTSAAAVAAALEADRLLKLADASPGDTQLRAQADAAIEAAKTALAAAIAAALNALNEAIKGGATPSFDQTTAPTGAGGAGGGGGTCTARSVSPC